MGWGGAPRQSDIPTLYQISHICTILLCMYIRVGRVGEWGRGGATRQSDIPTLYKISHFCTNL